MSPNTKLVQRMAGVVVAITAVTGLSLALTPEPEPPAPVEVARASGGGPKARGERVFEAKGCAACHSVDGSPKIGPSLAGRFGKPVTLGDGNTVVFDESYVRESLASPRAKAQAGYPPTMPSFDGLLQEREIVAVIEYIRTR